MWSVLSAYQLMHWSFSLLNLRNTSSNASFCVASEKYSAYSHTSRKRNSHERRSIDWWNLHLFIKPCSTPLDAPPPPPLMMSYAALIKRPFKHVCLCRIFPPNASKAVSLKFWWASREVARERKKKKKKLPSFSKWIEIRERCRHRGTKATLREVKITHPGWRNGCEAVCDILKSCYLVVCVHCAEPLVDLLQKPVRWQERRRRRRWGVKRSRSV